MMKRKLPLMALVAALVFSLPISAGASQAKGKAPKQAGVPDDQSSTSRLINVNALPAPLMSANEARSVTDAKTRELINDCLHDEKFVAAYKSLISTFQEKIKEITAAGYYDTLVLNGVNEFSRQADAIVEGIKGKQLAIMKDMLFKTLKSKGYRVEVQQHSSFGLGDVAISW